MGQRHDLSQQINLQLLSIIKTAKTLSKDAFQLVDTTRLNLFAGHRSAVAHDQGEDCHRGGLPLSGGRQLLLCQRPQTHQVLGTHH